MVPRLVRTPRANSKTAPGKKESFVVNRRTKLDVRLIESICAEARKGHPLDLICDRLGLQNATLYKWIRQGATYANVSEDDPAPPEEWAIFGKLYQDLRKEVAEYRADLMEKLHKRKDWFRALKILERRDRPTFGTTSKSDAGNETVVPGDEGFL